VKLHEEGGETVAKALPPKKRVRAENCAEKNGEDAVEKIPKAFAAWYRAQ